MKTERVKIKTLTLHDPLLSPRNDIDGGHIAEMVAAHELGVVFPPILACRKTRKVTDGNNRCEMYLRRHGEDAEVEVIWKDYKNDCDRFFDAMFYNSNHGRKLDSQDRAECVVKARKLGMSPDDISRALSMSTHAIEDLLAQRSAILKSNKPHTKNGDGEIIILKRGLRHLKGTVVSPEAAELNKCMPAGHVSYYVNILIRLLKLPKGIDVSNEKLVELLSNLRDALSAWLAKCEVKAK